MKHLLVIGRPGIGKTTLMKNIIKTLRGQSIDGFITEELREKEERAGFWLSPLDGRQVLLAHQQFNSDVQVGPFKVNTAILEEVAIPVLKRAQNQARLIFLDELGRMELCSNKFRQAVEALFNKGPVIVATGSISPIDFLEAIKRRKDVELIPLTMANRDMVEEELQMRLAAYLSTDDRWVNLQQQADRICELIVLRETSLIDIEIKQAALKNAVHQLFPDQPHLYQTLYETPFRRLWQQFGHSE